jgi:hypothetical protein
LALAFCAGSAAADDLVARDFEVSALDLCLPAAINGRSARVDGLTALSDAEKLDLTGQAAFDMYFAPSGQRQVLLVDRGPANCEVIALGDHGELRDFPDRFLIHDDGLFEEYPDMPENSRLFAGRGETTVLYVHDEEVTVLAARGALAQ